MDETRELLRWAAAQLSPVEHEGKSRYCPICDYYSMVWDGDVMHTADCEYLKWREKVRDLLGDAD